MSYKKPDFLQKMFKGLPNIKFDILSTALLVIDMQYLDASRDHGMGKKAKELKLASELDYYFSRIESIVIPNILSLQELFREKGGEIIFAKISNITNDGRERSLPHKYLDIEGKLDSIDSEILKEISPKPNEIVLSKTASGVFNSTNIDYILKNLGIKNLVLTGVLTNECVETACRNAADRSYNVILSEDSCAALTPEFHNASLKTLEGVYARIMKTKNILNFLKEE